MINTPHNPKSSLQKGSPMSQTDTIAPAPTTWRFTTSTTEGWDILLKEISQARESIYMEQFLFTPDSVGQKFMELFMKKAREGCSVKLIFDSFGSRSLGQSLYLKALADAGVKVKFFNWTLPFSKHSKKLFYFRNHRRIVLIDRKKMFTGGICIDKEMENWRETQILVEGPVVDQALMVFDKTWKRVYKKRTLNLGIQYKSGLDGFSFITQSPLIAGHHLYNRLIDAIRGAQKEIYLTTPYFLPDARLQRVLILARKRGVDVRILLPKNSNILIVDIGSATYYRHLLKHGVRIFRYENMVHAKVAFIDGDWAMIGSMNLDNVSLKYNFESAIITTNPLCASEVREHFMKDLQEAKELSLEVWQTRSSWQKFLEILVWPIRKFL